MWPKFEEYKHELEKWLNSSHPKYLKETGELEWANFFSGQHHSAVIIISFNKHLISTVDFNFFYNSFCAK
jgi:hypothetical protein